MKLSMSHPVREGYKYGDLALQFGAESSETVRCGHELCGTWIRETARMYQEREDKTGLPCSWEK
jgi:hypothetical protein